MARVIGQAAVRLVADSKTLKAEFKSSITRALREAVAEVELPRNASPTSKLVEDADRDGNKLRGILSGILGAGQAAGAGLASALMSGAKLALIGAQAGVAVAGIASLIGVIGNLAAVAAQAAGVLGLIPAALVAIKAVTTTVQLGMQGMSEAFKAIASGDAAAFQESLKGLAPAARAFAIEINKIKPIFDKMQLGVQQRLFDGLSGSVAALAQRYLPLARNLFNGLAVSINQAAKDIVRFAKDSDTVSRVSTTVNSIQNAFARLVPAFKPILSGFLDLVQVGSSFLPQLADGFTNVALKFGTFMRQAADSGKLASFFQTAIDTVKQLGQLFRNIGGIIGGVFKAAQDSGGGFLNNLIEITGEIKEFVKSVEGQTALKSFFQSMKDVIQAVLPIVLSLASTIGTTLVPILADLAKTLGPALLPVIDALKPALQAAAPGVAALAKGMAEFLLAATPLLPVIGELAGVVGGILGTVFKALAPVIAAVAKALQDGLQKLLPVLIPVIEQVATSLSQVLVAIVPLIPVVLQLLAAFLPILPPIAQLAAELMPQLVDIITALAPVVMSLGEVLTTLTPIIIGLASVILGILIPPIEFIARVVSTVASTVATVFTGMVNTIKTVLSNAGSFISNIWNQITGFFSNAASAISNAVSNGFNNVKNFISNTMSNIGTAVSNGITNVVNFFRNLPGQVLTILGDLANRAVQAGADIINGIVRGIQNLAGKIGSTLRNIVSSAWDGVLSALGISSPSKLAIWTFEQVGLGMVKGLENMQSEVVAAASGVANAAGDALMPGGANGIDFGMADMTSDASAGGSTAGTGGTVINQTNIMQPGADVQQFANEVWKRGGADLASVNSSLNVSQQSIQVGMAPPGSVVNLGV